MAGQAQTLARALAAGRVAVGAALCLAPELVAGWVGDAARKPGAQVAIRALGVRDAALGLGTLASLRDPAALRRWLVASSLCDAGDFVATLAGPRAPARTAVLALAAAAAAAGLGTAAGVQGVE